MEKVKPKASVLRGHMEENNHHVNMFYELEARLSAAEPKDLLGFKRDRVVIAMMLLGVAMTVPAMFGVDGTWFDWMTVTGLILELSGFGVLSYRQIRDVAPEFRDAKRKFAMELDKGFDATEQTLAWIRSLPEDARDRRLAYIESRLQSMSQRYPIVFGPVDKLGLLPILVGVFVQWQAIERVSVEVGLLAVFIFALYGMAIWMVRFRLQMQTYARLLAEAKVSD
ncbi:hypothetical protein [Luteimonas sp. SDU101]|uniref:hypothetical protein n=1 Tax=Luteimonas sp. SDU101 TaxID=3422593 RepID=UPI003EBA62F3